MAPARTKKQKTSASSDESIPAFPAPPSMTSKQNDAHVTTPERDSLKASATITQVQRQALVNNLQLEITERARKLRAQYALQAQGLRSRLEMRVNRIPQGLRKRKIQELLDEHTHNSKPTSLQPMPVSTASILSNSTGNATSQHNMKRKSDQISTDGDKENEPVPSSQQELANPKRRAKTTAPTANSKGTGAVSKPSSGTVLSPRSQNTRAQPARSPLRPAAVTEKSALPKASSSPFKSAAKAAVKAIGRAGTRKRAVNPSDTGRTSESSSTSNGTTVVSRAGTKKTTTTAKKPAVPKTVAPKTAAAAPKKAPATKKENVPANRTAGGRTLRTRA